jgi:hypothetical protein
MFETLVTLMKEPLRSDRGVKTDNSILLVYPPDRELDFREELVDECFPALEAHGVPFHPLDLTGFLFSGLNPEAVESLQEEEFDDYAWMLQGLSRRVEASLLARLKRLASEHSDTNLVLYGTVAVYPTVRLGEILRDFRDLRARVVIAFPGEEHGGKLHFMSQPDGGNYLAVKLFWQ